MTLKHMRIYLIVYRLGNITKAAESLSMTQPAVSRAIKEMENYYGVKFFERINQKLYRTEVGQKFYAYALHIIDSFEQMENDIRHWDEAGVIKVGTSITVGNVLLPKVLVHFRQQYPGIRVKAVISNGENLKKALLNNQIDFALVEGNVYDEQLRKEKVASDRLTLILPPDDTRMRKKNLFLEELQNDSFILREKGSMGRILVDSVFEMHGICVEPSIESASTQAIIRLVHEGLGISFLPQQLVQDAVKRGIVCAREVSDELFVTPYYLLWHKQKFFTHSAKLLMENFRQWNIEEITS